MTKVQITFEPEGKSVSVERGTSVFEAAKECGVKIRSECGGEGICSKCVILVSNPESVSPPTAFESEKIGRAETLRGKRLACLTKVLSDAKVEIPKESRIGQRQIQVEGLERKVELKPSITKIPVSVDPPSLEDLRSDAERLLAAIQNQGIETSKYDLNVLRGLSGTLREFSGEVVAVIRKEGELLEVKGKGESLQTLGFAVDVGTSKIIATLIDLDTGEPLAHGFVENPQMIYGEDVISRISHAMSAPSRLRELQQAAIAGIDEAIEISLKEAKASREHVYELVVVGNTAMHHLLLGIDPKWLALAPYVPTFREGMDLTAKQLGLKLSESARVHLPPVIAGFVGSDAVADLLTLQLHNTDRTILALDIGTNTEVFLASNGRVLTCSCASGPAFEGVHITHGMKAVTGAIERVKIDGEGRVVYSTIDGEMPKGLCGSGVIDLVAGLLLRGLVERTGRLKDLAESDRIRRTNQTLEFLVEQKERTATGQDIVFTQPDLREVQLAKSAIQTGWTILMEESGVTPPDLDAIYLAGAFGNYLDARNAKEIGLVPCVEDHKIFSAGNTALSGAKAALVSLREREEMTRIAEGTEYLELGAHPQFNKVFASTLNF